MGHDGIGGQQPRCQRTRNSPMARSARRWKRSGRSPAAPPTSPDCRGPRWSARPAERHPLRPVKARPALVWPDAQDGTRLSVPMGHVQNSRPIRTLALQPGGAAVPEGTAMSASQPEAEVISRRKHPRRRTNAPGTIEVYEGAPGIPCILENVSDGGAGLRFETNILLPPVFTLSVPAERVDRRCEVMWRDGYRVGVSFV